MAGKSSVPDWLYYPAAALCSLAAIPVYRYMLAHAADASKSSRPPTREHLFIEPPVSAPVSPATVLQPLRADESCKAGYLAIKNGNAYRQGMGPYGQPARCVPGYAYAHILCSAFQILAFGCVDPPFRTG